MDLSCSHWCSRTAWQFLLLVWKNFVLQFRRPIGTTFELVLPMIATLLIIALRVLLNFSNEDKCFTTFDSDQLMIPSTPTIPAFDLPQYNIFYTPQNNDTETIMELFSQQVGFSSPSPFNVKSFTTEEMMVAQLDILANTTERTNLCYHNGAGIVFGDLNGNELSYTIRLRHEVGPDNSWDTLLSAPEIELPGPRVSNPYLSEGFLHLQKFVGEAMVEWRTKKAGKPYQPVNVAVRQFPHPEYSIDYFLSRVAFFLPLLFVMAFIYSAGIFTKELVLEKESRIRESMLMMGLKQWVLWATWFVKQFIFFMVPVLVICILLKVFVFPRSDFILVFIFFTLYIIASISFLFALSVLFNSARVALIIGSVLWYMTYLPFQIVYGRFNLTLAPRLALSLLSNTAFGFGVDVISRLEQRNSGLMWTNVADPISADDQLSVGWICCVFIIDSILYMVFAWYINGVRPGQYGVPKPFYFPFLPSYWCGTSYLVAKKNELKVVESALQDDPSAHEEVIGNLEIGISIRNLTKIYSQIFNKKGRRKAVDNLNLDMYKGQITALLGHNGAGKTTIMSIITGLYTPTEGTAMINGYSILTDMDLIRNSLGICPQHNVLFDRLTVREHLKFFMHLKGIHDRKAVTKEVNQMIEDMQLSNKGNIQASKLSGGMKRKLSVGIALIGGSEVVILDEPTSGMDPYARRATWDLLAKYKQNCCMLLTTHFMDEADLLGDRIAILAEGKLRCSGSSLFLKGRYGVGYHMTIVKEPSCVSSEVERLVKSFVPSAEMVTNVGAELSFILPSCAVTQFPLLFDEMESRKTDLGVASFGVSVTTMEEVFTKVGEGTDKYFNNRSRYDSKSAAVAQTPYEDELKAADSDEHYHTSAIPMGKTEQLDGKTEVDILEEQLTYQFTPNTGIILWLQQFWAMFLKKFYNSLLSYLYYPARIIVIFIPKLFVVLGFITILATPRIQDDPPRVLTLNNSGLDSKNITLFYADLVGKFMNFSKYSAQDLFVTELFDISDNVNDLRNSIDIIGNLKECCNYRYQILDKFCASRSADSLLQCRKLNESFGYNHCIDSCLTCCGASNSSLASCSHPVYPSPTSNDIFCPSPPSLSISSTTSGPLDTMNTFVAEHLLRLSMSTELDPITFFRRYQAGFTVTGHDPFVTVCGYNQSNAEDLESAEVCSDFEYLATFPCNSTDAINETCPQTSCSVSADENICEINDTCFPLDPYSADLVQICSCSDEENSVGLCEIKDITDHSLPLLNRSISKVYPKQLDTPAITVWYNNGPLHMSAAALNAFQSLRLKEVTGNDSLSLVIINHPLPRNDTLSVQAVLFSATGFGFSIIVVFGYSFMLANFVSFLVSEKETKAKHLQFVSGVSASSYWLSTLTWDILNALVLVILTIVVFVPFQVDAFKGSALGAVFLVLILTCWAGIPMTYIFSFFFTNSLAAVSLLILLFFFASLLLMTVVFLVQVYANNGERTADVLHHIFLLAPTYGLSSALNNIYRNHELKDFCQGRELFCRSQNVTYVDNVLTFDQPGVGLICLYLFLQGCLYFTLTILMEHQFFYPKIKHFFNQEENLHMTQVKSNAGEDADVYNERKRVTDDEVLKDEVVVIKNLVKVYCPHLSGCSIQPAKTAVAGISLGIPSGECFGLLGVNGAGKTTTFSILTGDISMTSGTAIIAGYDVRTELKAVQQRLGFCPQFDALIEQMTGRELLVMFARLRGVPEGQLKEVVNTEIRRLDLRKYADKRCGTYSGGNKRKLSTAIALVGNPPIVMLDEPTTGMDPNTRRYLWDVLTKVTHEGRSIILTSHSMEECEALCTRLAIMVNGQFKCLGSIQHLKNKYGSGFILQAKVKLSPSPNLLVKQLQECKTTPEQLSTQQDLHVNSNKSFPTPTSSRPQLPLSSSGQGNQIKRIATDTSDPYDTTTLRSFITETFHGAALMEEHQGSVTYQLPSAGVTWSSVFRQLESNKQRLGIVDYSVSQTTLEQVFLNFAKEQKEEGN